MSCLSQSLVIALSFLSQGDCLETSRCSLNVNNLNLNFAYPNFLQLTEIIEFFFILESEVQNKLIDVSQDTKQIYFLFKMPTLLNFPLNFRQI